MAMDKNFLGRLVVGLIALGLGYGVVWLAGWTDLHWVDTGVPIITSTIAIALFNVWKARRVRH